MADDKQQRDPFFDEIDKQAKGGGVAVATQDDPFYGEIDQAAKKQKAPQGPQVPDESERETEKKFPVAPLEGQEPGMFPSPTSRTALPEGPPIAPPAMQPTAVPGPFGEPEAPQFIQQRANEQELAARTAEMRELDARAARQAHPIREAFAGPDTTMGRMAGPGAPELLAKDPWAYLKSIASAPVINMRPALEASQTVHLPSAPGTPIDEASGLMAVGRGALASAQGFLEPQNIATIAAFEATGGLVGTLASRSKALYAAADAAMATEDWDAAADAIAKAKKITGANNALKAINFTVGTKFTGQFAYDLYQNSKEFKKAVDAGDQEKALEVLGEALPNAAFTFFGVKDLFEAGARVKEGIAERTQAKRTARADVGLTGETVPEAPAKAEVVPEEQVPEELKKQPAPAATEAKAKAGIEVAGEPEKKAVVPEEPAQPESLGKPGTKAYQAKAKSTEKKLADTTYHLQQSREKLADINERGEEAVQEHFGDQIAEFGPEDLEAIGGEGNLVNTAKQRLSEDIAADEAEAERLGKLLGRRTTEGTAPGEERRQSLKDIQGPPSRAVLEDVNKRLAEPGLSDFEKEILTARKESLEEHPEDVEALRGEDLGRIREEGKKPATPEQYDEGLQKEFEAGGKAPVPEKGSIEMPVPEEPEKESPKDSLLVHKIPEAGHGSMAYAVHRSMTSMSGYSDRIKKAQKNGATDQELLDLASYSFGIRGGMTNGQHGAIDYKGGKNPEVSITGISGKKVTVKGQQLTRTIRDLYGITTPGNQVTVAPGDKLKMRGGMKRRSILSEQPLFEEKKAETEVPTEPTAKLTAPEQERTVPVKEEEHAAEPSSTPRQEATSGVPGLPESLGGVGEEELEREQPEPVQPTGEEREARSSGEERGAADLERPTEHGEPGLRISERVGSGEGTVHVPAERGRPAGPRREPGQQSSGNKPGNDYRITAADEIGSGGIRAKYRDNLSAIRTLKAIEQEGRLATPTEQAQLVKYVGWGGMPQAFDQNNRKWNDEYKELLETLSEDEYRAARASTPNAHYTSPTVISAMWDAVRRMGFNNGRMLEPSAGVGHFLGLMPADLADQTRKTAIELDPITGRILKQLYQSADARIQGFEKFNGKDGTYDLVVGNVPFGNYKVNDPGYNKHNLNIHNYFILKSLDKLRPGGIAAVITSSSTLDSQESKHRKLFGDKADLVGAIRLPNTAFKGNANTEVTTDILFFQKHDPNVEKNKEAFQLSAVPEGSDIPINTYFHKHPDMMLGTMQRAGTMYGPDQPALIAPEDQDLSGELQKAVEKLPRDVFVVHETPKGATDEAVADATPGFGETKQYGLKIQKGQVFRKLGDSLVPVANYPAKSVRTLKEMLGMRDAVRELFEAEGKDRSKATQDKLRARLNQVYDTFVEKHGPIHGRENERAMQHDPELPLLLSLEKYDPETKTARKADVFFKQTIAPRAPVTRVDNPKDAMLVSLQEKGRLDFDHMESITGKSPEELQRELKSEGLVFHAPDGHWETTDSYLSGNVRKKLAEARDAAERNAEFKDNVKALEAVMPKDVEPSKIYARLGSSWVPREVMKDFVSHIFGSDMWGRQTDIQHVDTMGLWTMRVPYGARDNVNATVKWGTKRAPADYLIEQALNLREPVVYDKDAEGKSVINQTETLAAREKMEALNEEFKRWMFQDSPHATELSRIYNEHFNSEVDRDWNGSHLTLPGKSVDVHPAPHQLNQIWRNLNGGNQLVAHEVGTGKTYIMIGTAMEMRRLGQARKPVITVPKNVVEQVTNDFRRMYPEANVLMADKESFATENRKEFAARMATGDWDGVVMSHNQLEALKVSQETYENFMNEQIDAARALLSEVAREEGKRGPTVKQIEKNIKSLEAKIEKRAKLENKDDTINFETLGIDALIVDEAHNFKRLWFPTKMGRVPGVPSGDDANRAMDMYIKSRYITRLNNGKNVIFATGTPISNTMAEMFVMQKFLDEDYLAAHGMQHFDSWAANFGQKETKLEVRPENPGAMRMHTRFSKFVNVSELTRMFRRIADIKTVKELGLKVPKVRVQLVTTQPSARLQEYTQELSARAEKIRGRPPEKGGDNMLNITTDGRKASTDMRLIDPSEEDHPDSKVNQAVNKVAQIYHDNQETRATQLMLLDLGVPSVEGKKMGRFNLYADMKRKLVARGIPADEIKFIQDAKDNDQKQALFNDVNAGKVRVVMGSTPLLGVGVNIQKRLLALHHIDAPPRPMDIEQRNGRMVRQGNDNPEVQEYRYVTEGSFDAYMWQLLEKKAGFVAQAMKGDPNLRELEDIDDFALSAAEIKAIATGNPLIMRKVETEFQLQKLTMLASAHAREQFDNKARLARIPEEITSVKDTIKKTQADIDKRDSEKPEKFSVTIGKSNYPERKEGGAALNEAIIKNAGMNEKRIGKFNGFDVYARGNMDGFVRGENSYFFQLNPENPLGTMQSLEAAVRNMETRLDNRKLRLDELTKEQEERRGQLDIPFNKQAELEKLLKQKKEIDDQLDIKNRGAGETATAEGEEPERKPGEGGFVTLDMLTLGLPSLYRRIMKAWRNKGAAGEPQRPPTQAEAEEPEERQEEPPQRDTGVPEEPPGVEQPSSKAAKPGEKAINIRLDKLNSPEDVIQLVRDTAKTHAGRIQFQRRGRLSDKELQTRMEQVGLDPDKLAKLPKGKALNEAEIEVAIGIMQNEGQKIRDAAKAVRDSNSAENILRAQALHNRYVAIQAAVSGITAEAGRSLRTFRRIHNALDRDDRSGYEKVVESLGGRGLSEKEAQKLLEIPEDDLIGYYKFLRNHARFTTAQKLTYYWLNNLLSSPRTPIRKLMGDATMVGLNIPKTFMRAAIDPLIAGIQRRPTEYHMRDALTQTAAFFGALPEGLKKASFVLRNGFEYEDAKELDLPGRYELPGGYATNFPTRNLAAATAMFKTMHFQSTLAGEAMREALRSGLRGRDAGNYAAELLDDPPDEMVTRAMQEANKLALVEEPDSFLRGVLRMRNWAIPQEWPVVGGLAPLRFVIPFVNIGWNIGKMAVRYSPLGAARVFKESARKTPEATNHLAEALVGTMILAALASYASKGNITGPAPKGGGPRDAFYRAGKQPFSIKIAGHWVSYTGSWGIMAPALSAMAAWYDAHEKNQKLPDSKQISQVGASIGAAMTDQPLFRGVQTLMEALTNPQGHAVETFEAEAAAGFVPYSSLMRTTAGAIDPAVRDPRGIYERIQAGLPLLSEQLPQRVDVLGRGETKRGAEGAKSFLPSAIPEAAPLSPTDAELERLQEAGLRNIAPTGQFITVQNTKIPLTRSEQTEYQRLRGTVLRRALELTFQDEQYKALDDADKIKETENVIRQVNEFARDQMVERLIERRVGPQTKQETAVPTQP